MEGRRASSVRGESDRGPLRKTRGPFPQGAVTAGGFASDPTNPFLHVRFPITSEGKGAPTMEGRHVRRGLAALLVLAVLFGSGPGAWAMEMNHAGKGTVSAPVTTLHRYGQLVSDEQLEELDGEWAHIVIGGLYGGLGSAVSYTVTYYGNGFTWADLGRSTAIGAASGAVAAAFGSPLLSTFAGGLSAGLMERWWW